MAKHPGGRPTKYKPEFCETIVEFMRDGSSLTEFAASIDVDKNSLDDWAKAHPEFSGAKKRAMVVCEAWWTKQLKDGVWNKYQSDNVNVAAVAFVLKSRFGWRDKDPAVVTNNNIGTSIQDLEALAKQIEFGARRNDAE